MKSRTAACGFEVRTNRGEIHFETLCVKTEKLLQSKLQAKTPWNETFNLGYNSHESSTKGLLCHHQHALLATLSKANLAIRLGILKTMHMPSLRHA